MRADRLFRVAVLGLAIALSTSACAGTAHRGGGAVGGHNVSIQIDNQSAEQVMVVLARVGSSGEVLGRVNALAVRTFRVSRESIHGGSVELFAVPVRDPHDMRRLNSTLPFVASGSNEVAWIVREGGRLSAVTLR